MNKTSSYSNSVSVNPEVIKSLQMSFSSIEEIERMKRDSNQYKATQRNGLGVAKSSKIEGNRRMSKMNWIDLFNIGNVMLMRGQDIQMGHTGWNEVCESDFPQEDIDQSLDTSASANEMPELSLKKCSQYTIGKDSFTEIVLLSVIAYFCVSTEQRFINMNNEKEKSENRSVNEGTNRSILNNSNPNSMLRSTKDQTVSGGNSKFGAETRQINLGTKK
jgi:hypothetical protein